jgi:hypothetical protein
MGTPLCSSASAENSGTVDRAPIIFRDDDAPNRPLRFTAGETQAGVGGTAFPADHVRSWREET